MNKIPFGLFLFLVLSKASPAFADVSLHVVLVTVESNVPIEKEEANPGTSYSYPRVHLGLRTKDKSLGTARISSPSEKTPRLPEDKIRRVEIYLTGQPAVARTGQLLEKCFQESQKVKASGGSLKLVVDVTTLTEERNKFPGIGDISPLDNDKKEKSISKINSLASPPPPEAPWTTVNILNPISLKCSAM
ncbi:MAG: hypothetical protein QOI66_5099 [Myxococcales bacterium]|nr:hypothetical protein [Myxococcales bacterium]